MENDQYTASITAGGYDFKTDYFKPGGFEKDAETRTLRTEEKGPITEKYKSSSQTGKET